jgi:hypothetical protein
MIHVSAAVKFIPTPPALIFGIGKFVGAVREEMKKIYMYFSCEKK